MTRTPRRSSMVMRRVCWNTSMQPGKSNTTPNCPATSNLSAPDRRQIARRFFRFLGRACGAILSAGRIGRFWPFVDLLRVRLWGAWCCIGSGIRFYRFWLAARVGFWGCIALHSMACGLGLAWFDWKGGMISMAKEYCKCIDCDCPLLCTPHLSRQLDGADYH